VYAHISRNGVGDGDAHIASADYQTFYRHHCGTPMGWDGELALFLASEVPPGTGLGSSSAITVALVQAVATYLHRSLSRQQVAELACEVELGRLKAPIGKQDQFAAASVA
jgi:D-glycero-alpha-D-manno-heptose-7-phosphate kinase